MKPRPLDLAVTLAFLGAIATPPIVQAVVELGRGERPRALALLDRPPTAANLRAYERELEDASGLIGLLRPAAVELGLRVLGDGGDKALLGIDGWMFYRPSVRTLIERPPAAAGPVDDPLPAILAFRDDLEARGIELLVVPVPNKESIYPEKLTARARSTTVAVGGPTADLLARLRDAGVETVDLFEAFREAKGGLGAAREAPLYLREDTHWSPRGVDVAARAIARKVLGSGWIPPGVTAFGERPAPVRRVGDLLRMLQAPRLEAAAEPEAIEADQVLGPGGALYRDDPASPVLVLGDSFLRIYETDEPGSAGLVAHLARELGRPLFAVISDGGASTLVRQEVARRPALLGGKRVVLWEFVERDILLGMEGWKVIRLAALPAPRPR